MNNHSHNKSMTIKDRCHHGDCEEPAKWGISSSVKKANPDGTPLTLFACDDHEEALTSMMRAMGTRYMLFPIDSKPHITAHYGDKVQESSKLADAPYENELREMSILARVAVNLVIVTVGVIISPAILIYFGGKWALGWRPGSGDE